MDKENKIYIKVSGVSRKELAEKIGDTFKIDEKEYSVNDVKAEVSNNSTAASVVIGSAIGSIMGPIGIAGIVLGGLIGGFLGKNSDDKEKEIVNNFNSSKL